MLSPVFGVLLAFVTALLRAHALLHLANLVLRGAMAAEHINEEEIRATVCVRDWATRYASGIYFRHTSRREGQ
jgi:hypothetical protein